MRVDQYHAFLASGGTEQTAIFAVVAAQLLPLPERLLVDNRPPI